ncbi:TetR/AcrR family transcriptional regulator [Nocardia sp. NPDC059240]|uniref:TetR/AcrR family transcriptional regulator n=1 Tax=Nocardia sp. NPDC059240 TaxID=3346786 RepID=UPI0036C97477
MAYRSTTPELLAEAVFDIAATRGLDAASVREVATAADVSIGAVQHHFRTKDELYAFAFEQLVTRVRSRITRVDPNTPLPKRLLEALSHLLPLDAEREREGRVMLAFTARAATNESLARLQSRTLDELRAGLAIPLAEAGIPDPELHAALLLSAVDGLTMDALSTRGLYTPTQLTKLVSLQVQLILAHA